jgi:prepilin-type N-terminal cleavage/methylation domain-containing protein
MFWRKTKMNLRNSLNLKGITLIELLVALLIFGMAGAGIYRLFVGHSTAYVIQEQVAEVQQDVRGAAELLTRDLRMAGYKNDNSTVSVNRPIFPGTYGLTAMNNAVRIEYEVEAGQGNSNTRCTVVYNFNAGRIIRELYVDNNNIPVSNDVLLGNVTAFNFTYGLDIDSAGEYDGAVDQWVSGTNVNDRRVIAVQFVLAAGPDPNETFNNVSPRTLTTTVPLRNQMVKDVRGRL